MWEDMFKHGGFVTAREFCECAQVEINVYMLHCKYNIKPCSSPFFSATCAAGIAHRNHFFCL